MREIKFRAWDGELMHNVSELQFCMGPQLDGKGLKFYGPGVGSGWIDGESIYLMQYTGLNDKNGKEIYEGDIIRRYFEIGHTEFDPITLGATDYIIDDEGYFIGVVHFRPTEGYVLNKCRKYDVEDNLVSKKSGVKIYPQYAEVIGNIHKNPELLRGNKE